MRIINIVYMIIIRKYQQQVMKVENLEILRKCAEEIRRRILPLVGTKEAAKTYGRGAGGDLTKEIDLRAEKALIKKIEEEGVSCTILSEEKGIIELGESPKNLYIICDPLDGTTNALHGVPFMATSIAMAKKPLLSQIEAAVVMDIIHNVTYAAEKGRGAYKNNERIRPSQETDLVEAVIGVDINTYKAANQTLHEKITRIIALNKHPRYFGANALQLCYVADGTIDAFVDIRGKMRVLDMAAAYLIVREAGGIVTAPDGSMLEAKLTPQQRISLVAAGNRKLHEEILRLICD